MSKRSKFIIILLLVLTAAVIVWALFGMDQGVETPPVELPMGLMNDPEHRVRLLIDEDVLKEWSCPRPSRRTALPAPAGARKTWCP